MENNFIKPMYKPPKVTVVQFQIESGFAGSGGVRLVDQLFNPALDNTTAYTATSNSGDDFWGGESRPIGTGGTSSYGDFEQFGW